MKKLFVMGLFFLNACAAQHELVGTWKSGSFNLFQRGNACLRGYFLSGSNELRLNADSTWRLKEPCQVSEGNRWHVKDDSLYLFPDTTWLINEEARQNRPPSVSLDGYRAYKVKPGKLINQSHARYETAEIKDSIIWHNVILYEKLRMKN